MADREDSNPRYALGVHTISNRAPSTTRPSILNICLTYNIRKNFATIFSKICTPITIS